MADDEPVIKEIFIDAAPAEVFPYLTRSEKYVLWMGWRPRSTRARAGSSRSIRTPATSSSGSFSKSPRRTAPHRFHLGLERAGPPGPGRDRRASRSKLQPRDGGALLRLKHYHLPGPSRGRHDSGWSHYLSRLKIVLRGGDPGPDPYADPQVRH